ncbi:sensor histidine kinase [Paenibacillus fonticola]|uniref:sensor histidine kinase n=1 Tax=Paenibacillus fonticola TaxID=379896 RepID=UPI0003661F19|nr:histidine kinase [Paenibacillus fonticola]
MRLLKQTAWNSIRFKLVIGFLTVTIPLFILLFYNNYYAIHVVREQVAMSNKNMMSLYMGQIDNGLEEVNKYFNTLISSNMDLQIMERPLTPDDYMLAKTHLSDKLTTDVLMYRVDSFFIYSSNRADLLDIVSNDRITYNEKEILRSYIHSELSGAVLNGRPSYYGWDVKQLNGEYYLFRIQQLGSVFVGAWVKAETLMMPLTYISMGENGASLLITDQGIPMISSSEIDTQDVDLTRGFNEYYLTGTKKEFLIVGEKSKKGDFSLAVMIPGATILQNLPYLNRIVYILSFLGLLLIPGFLMFIRNNLLIPLKRIVSVMNRIGEGNVKFRIESHPTSDEFQLVNKTFNHMMAQIEELKINVYEEKLSKQKAELQHLQLQINPHFFLNTLNIIYNLALVNDYELIKEMTLRLVRYFRYMFRSNLTLLPLQEELDHVRNYIQIQQLRFQESLSYEIKMPEALSKVYVPPLVIQTFVENSIKHAPQVDHPLYLSIEIETVMQPSFSDPHIRIIIRDTGKGFPDDILLELQAGKRIIDEQGEHIGIWNVWHRLRLLYGERSVMSFYNQTDSGAVVEIRLPLQTDQ